ncbi:hypothetical protein C0Q70_19629 [Pomacea canaliculata]|uniref:Inositol 1,4,5-trisphosphate receptor n=1 Tax=Pomacea canaliculata TaxID=400727 RepID=A0A2T7NJX4_POMCA|nr:hypothetical protein C0Q70_19629 [Pomacea canaliculata]
MYLQRSELNGFSRSSGMGEYLCIGDYLCLYCEETEGFVYSHQSSTANNGLFVFSHQDRNRPTNIPNPHAVVFQICIQNRYKLNKKYRKWLALSQVEGADSSIRAMLLQAKMAADAEDKDNLAEQTRQHGKRVRYGEIVQLKHMFTGKFVHMNTTHTSKKDKNNMKVSLVEFNAKNAQFRILPRYKVKSEGEVVQLYDQIVFESVKSPGHYFHASEPYQIDHFSFGAELNLGVERSSFTLIGSYRESLERNHFVRFISAFAPLTSTDPSPCPPRHQGSRDVLRWEQQVRLRHLLTRQYLCIDAKMDVSLVPDPTDPRTVFRLHSVLKERDEIQFESYARIEHMLTSSWLHALKDEDYKKHQYEDGDNERSMQGLRWDGAAVRKVSASSESMYDDAYTIQWTEPEDVSNFNYVAGMVPFLFNLIQDTLKEIKDFMLPDGLPRKERTKTDAKSPDKHCPEHSLFVKERPLVIDLLVKLLQCPLREGDEEAHMIRVFKEAYDVLHAYMIGKSRKNALYFAKYIDFFQTQFTQKGGIGLNVAQMIVELIRDKRKIVDRITHTHVQNFIQLLRSNQNYRFLDLLQVLCVCDGVAIPNNQTYIVRHWLKAHKESIYLLDRGQNINKRPNIVYVSMDSGNTWVALHQFVDPTSEEYEHERYQYLLRQLELFKALCFGRNDFAIHVITREHGYVTWEDAFLCLQSELLPDAIRAKFCELIIGLFVDVGNNYSVLDNPNICFVYEYVGSKDSDREQSQYVVKDLVTIFPVLRDWLADFLSQNCTMTASMIGRNLLIEQVLRLLHHLVKFGYYMDLDDVRKLLPPLLSLLDGRHDVPFPKDKSKGYSKDSNKAVTQYRSTGRFETSAECEAIVDAKYQAMEVLDLLLTFQRNQRLKVFVTMFKQAEQGAAKRKSQSVLEPLLYEAYNPSDQKKKAMKKQKEVLRELREMFHTSAIFDIERTTAVLMDLSNYKYDKMVVKSLDILNKMYSSQHDMFRLANNAQVLLTHDSARVHREVQRSLPTLRRLARAKLNDQQVALMSEVLDELCEFCHLPKTPDEPHHMNQNIMISHGVLKIVLDILSQEIESKLIDQYAGMETVFKKTLYLLRLLIRENHKVQDQMFDTLDKLLDVQIVRSDLALALKEIFIGNQTTCLKVHSRQVQRIVMLAAESQQAAPEFLDLLRALVKVEGLDLTIKRNQALVMKYIMQNFKKAAYVLDQPRRLRESILTNQTERGHLTYFISLVDLLATCAEGENKFIESLCQTILPVEDLLWVANHPDIDCNLKRPFLHFMLWVYMKTSGNLVESGAADLQHDKSMWDFINSATGDIQQLVDYLARHPDKIPVLLKAPPAKSEVAESADTRAVMHHALFYVLDGLLPFLHVFYTVFYSPDKDVYTNELNTTESIANALIALCDLLGGHVQNPQHLRNFVLGLTTVVSVSNASKALLVSVLERFMGEMKLFDTTSAVRRGNMEYYATELELNAKFHTFTSNCMLVHCGHNTVQAQLKVKCKREYTARGTNEELPLGEEFQSLARCFLNPHEKKAVKRFALASKLIEQLWISATQCKQPRKDQPTHPDLDVRCLQILRTLIHNEERRLPEDWALRTSENKIKKQLVYIKEVQVALNVHSTIIKVLPHLARRNDDIVREVLAFICIMLFNANRVVQQSMLEYFLSTREEVFFMAVRDRMQISTNAIKEKRSLLAQHEARVKEALANMTNYNTSLTVGKKALQQIQIFEQRMKTERLGGWEANDINTFENPVYKPRALCRAIQPSDEIKLRRRLTWRRKSSKERSSKKNRELRNGISASKDSEALIGEQTEIELSGGKVEEVKMEEDVEVALDEGVKDMLEYKDDGYIELVLKLLARICDGQHTGLQNYLREQPDNVKSFNIVGETAQFLNVVYTTITNKTIDLVIQLFSTLTEFCSGNQENRVSVYDKKVIDYINFILRAGDIADCPIEKVIELQQTIGSLVIALIEENGPGASQVAKEVKDALDKEAVCRCLTACYEMYQAEKKTKLEGLGKGPDGAGGYLQSAKTIAAFGGSLLQGVVKGKKKNALKESVMEVGFTYYLILARMTDIDPHLPDSLQLTPDKQKALDYYKKNCLSIEIVKEDILQKVNFRVKNKSVLREEVKEKLKWNVDRTSPTNKIRDLMGWTRDIMRDISYQRKILDNPIAKMFTKGWLLWNYGATVLSLAINVMMLVTWNAQASVEDFEKLKNNNNITISPLTYDPKPKIVNMADQDYTIILWALGGVHNLFSLFVLISYLLSNHPRLPRLVDVRNCWRGMVGNKPADEEETTKEDDTVSKLHIQFFSFTTFYYLMFLGMSVAGTMFHGYFFAFHLLNVVNNNQLLSGVIKAVTLNGMSLLWVAVLGFIVIYIYSLLGFALLRSYFDPGSYLYCSTLIECTVTVIRYGLIGDMFEWRAESDMKDTCFICSRNSYDFEHHGKGFDWHVRHEHNMWAYVYFIMHLDDIQASDYTALELYVARLMENENYEFMPLNRALCLSSVDIDSTESKIDELLHQVTSIAKKQREDEAEKKRKMEKLKQRRWQEKHRRFIFGVTASEYDTDRDPLLPQSRAVSVDRYVSREASACRDSAPTNGYSPEDGNGNGNGEGDAGDTERKDSQASLVRFLAPPPPDFLRQVPTTTSPSPPAVLPRQLATDMTPMTSSPQFSSPSTPPSPPPPPLPPPPPPLPPLSPPSQQTPSPEHPQQQHQQRPSALPFHSAIAAMAASVRRAHSDEGMDDVLSDSDSGDSVPRRGSYDLLDEDIPFKDSLSLPPPPPPMPAVPSLPASFAALPEQTTPDFTSSPESPDAPVATDSPGSAEPESEDISTRF